MQAAFRTNEIELFHGDTLKVLPGLEAASYDALITDPPYCSGGTTTSQRQQDPSKKYCHDGNTCGRPSFGGDVKDQRSFTWWTMNYLIECRRLLKEGAYCLVFTDWRQLPATTDALQAADFTWRGIIAWDKGPASRSAHKGYARHQCEYLVVPEKEVSPQKIQGGVWVWGW